MFLSSSALNFATQTQQKNDALIIIATIFLLVSVFVFIFPTARLPHPNPRRNSKEEIEKDNEIFRTWGRFIAFLVILISILFITYYSQNNV